MAKHQDAPYRSGRVQSWVKLKCASACSRCRSCGSIRHQLPAGAHRLKVAAPVVGPILGTFDRGACWHMLGSLQESVPSGPGAPCQPPSYPRASRRFSLLHRAEWALRRVVARCLKEKPGRMGAAGVKEFP